MPEAVSLRPQKIATEPCGTSRLRHESDAEVQRDVVRAVLLREEAIHALTRMAIERMLFKDTGNKVIALSVGARFEEHELTTAFKPTRKRHRP